MYASPMINGDIAVVVVNWRELDYPEFSFDLNTIGLNIKTDQDYYAVRDLWLRKTVV